MHPYKDLEMDEAEERFLTVQFSTIRQQVEASHEALKAQMQSFVQQVNQRLDTMESYVRRLDATQIDLIKSQERQSVKIETLEAETKKNANHIDAAFSKVRKTDDDIGLQVASIGKAFEGEIEAVEEKIRTETKSREGWQTKMNLKIASITGGVVALLAVAQFVGFRILMTAIDSAVKAAMKP